jgi:hypothetical protein
MMAMDIDSASQWGWQSGNYAANWQTFQGFTDYVAGRSSTDPSCPSNNTTWIFQYMMYSSSRIWQDLINTKIANTPFWTNVPDCTTNSQPPNMNPAVDYVFQSGYHDWNYYSNWLENWQFDTCDGGNDWDLGFNQWYMPLFGNFMS